MRCGLAFNAGSELLGDPVGVLRLSGAVAAVAVVVSAAEMVYAWRNYTSGGPFDRGDRSRAARAGPVPVLTAALLRFAAALPLLWPPTSTVVVGSCAAAALLLGVVLERYSPGGGDGAEGILSATLGGVAIGLLSGTPAVASAAVAFIAMQAVLAYSVAGWYKAFSFPWRSGEALPGILALRVVGNHRVRAFLARHRTLAKRIAWATIVWECASPVVLLAPAWMAAGWLIVGLLFHLMCARIMGLNTFLWSFVSTYPAVLYANHHLRRWI